MAIVRFATICDHCGTARSEEYIAWPSCRECLQDTCPECATPGSHEEEEWESGVRVTCLCHTCHGVLNLEEVL